MSCPVSYTVYYHYSYRQPAVLYYTAYTIYLTNIVVHSQNLYKIYAPHTCNTYTSYTVYLIVIIA